MELPDTTSGVPLVLAWSVKIRPGSNLEVPLECTRQLTDQMDIRIDTGFHHKNPNIYIPPCCINNPNNKHNPRYMPLTVFNLSTVDHLYIGKDTVIAFAEQPVLETYNIELASEDKIKEHLAKPRNWVPQKHETLPEIPHDTAFLGSPADVPGPRKVQLQDKDITTDIRQKFEELCDEYGEAFSKNNEDIGRTKLVKMDIDTGDSPPVSSRPYILPLKHYEWVQREIESLEWDGVITKSMSKWASPIVIVPKKSAPGEPPKRRLCVDFRKVNELQQEVITAGKSKGQISIHPLPKIDEMYAKLKGAKVFSTIDLRSGYHHIALGKSSRAKTAFVMPFDAQILLRSDHKPLEKFLLKNTLNSKVNNWAMELEAFNIQFDYIKGSSNILADTLSHLIAIDLDTPTRPEEPGYEFGYAIFEEFPKVTTKTYEVNEVIVGTNTEIFKNDPELQNSLQCIENPIAPQRLKKLQQQDTNIEILKRKLRNNRLDKEYYSLDKNELLMRKVIDGGHEFCAIYLPSVLIFQVLWTAHDDLGHNGFPRTYAAIK